MFRRAARKELAQPKIFGAIRRLPTAWLMKAIPIHGQEVRFGNQSHCVSVCSTKSEAMDLGTDVGVRHIRTIPSDRDAHVASVPESASTFWEDSCSRLN
jgi:hypothetical protein